jgi:hypothetical protein
VRAGLAFGGREVGERLGEALRAGVDQPRARGRIAALLLLEERREDDRACTPGRDRSRVRSHVVGATPKDSFPPAIERLSPLPP